MRLEGKMVLFFIGLVWFILIIQVGCDPNKRNITFISIGTGGTGGAFYPYGGGLAEIWSKYVPGVKALAEVTAASVENVRLAHKGETVIGEIMGDVAYQAYTGQGKFSVAGPQKILGLAVMYPSTLQVVTLKNSGLVELSQLKGRIVSVGAPGSGTAFMCELVLPSLDLPLNTFSLRRLSFVETSNALKDHTIQAGIWCVAPPTSSILDLSTTHGINILPLSSKDQETICRKYPFYSAYTLSPGLYRGVDTEVPTISVWNIIICYAHLNDDLVYSLTKVLFEQNGYLKNIHPYARFTTIENTLKHSPIPLHPGAIKFLREQGNTIPAKLINKNKINL